VSLKELPVGRLKTVGAIGILRVQVPPLTIVLLDSFGMSASCSIIVEDEASAVWGKSLQYLLL